MVRQNHSKWKANYFKKLSKHLEDCEKCFIVGVDNVRSKQLQQIRLALRGNAELVMGKNTLMKKVIQAQLARNSNLEKLIPHIRQNVGLVFTKGDLLEVRQILEANQLEAPARAGAIAPCDVVLPAHNTGLPPEKTSFFGGMNIPTKITRGTIDIISDVHLIKKDQKVGMSEATLLSMLKIYPFKYGLVISQVFDQGSIYDPAVLDITPDMVLETFMTGVASLVSLSLASRYTTIASVPHLLMNGFKDLIAMSVATEYTFSHSAKVKEYLADPSKFAITAPTAFAQSASVSQTKDAAPAAVVEESESDSDIVMGLFD